MRKREYLPLTLLITFGICLLSADNALAYLSVEYHETELSNGWWEYEYTVANPYPAGSDGDVYDITLFHDETRYSYIAQLPAGWDAIVGLGFADIFSLNSGPLPTIGTDIGPGSRLSGFSFHYNYRPGPLSFSATATNPLDPKNPLVIEGITAHEIPSVPLPAAGLLLSSGLLGLARLRRRRRSRVGHILLVAAAMVILTGEARALTATFTDSLTGWSPQVSQQVGTLQLDRFDPSLGTLNAVTIDVSNHFTWKSMAENTDGPNNAFTHVLEQQLAVKDSDKVLLDDIQPFTGSWILGTWDGVFDFGGTSGITAPGSSMPATARIVVTGSDLAGYIGGTPLIYTVHSHSKSTYTLEGSNGAMGAQQSYYATATVTYDYTPPAPFSAEFSATRTNGIAPLEVSFSDISQGEIQSRTWDFGDGFAPVEYITPTNPTHLYETPGNYTVTLTIEGQGGSSTTSRTVTVQRDYTLVVTAPTTPLSRGQNVPINGSVIASDGQPIRDIPVKLDFFLHGSLQTTFTAYTNTVGEFSYTFVTPSTMAGNFTLNATADSDDGLTKTASTSFEILGLYMQTPRINVTGMYMNTQRIVNLVLQNIGESALGGLSYSLVDANPDDAVTATAVFGEFPTSIAPGETISLPVTINAPLDSAPPVPALFSIAVTSTDTGETERGDITVSLVPAVSQPVITPDPLHFGVKQGVVAIKNIRVMNQGTAPMANATISLHSPDTFPWISIVNPGPGRIDISQSKDYQITLSPPATVVDGVYAVQLDLVYNGIVLPFQVFIEVTPSEVGQMAFKIYDDTGAIVENASVHMLRKTLNAQGYNDHITAISDGGGSALFTDLPVDGYRYIVTAANHDSQEGELLVEPGDPGSIAPEKLIVLVTQLVQVEFTVTPAVIQDDYKETVTVTYTPTPLPTPTADPNTQVIQKPMLYCWPGRLDFSFFPEDPQEGVLNCTNTSPTIGLRDVVINSVDLDAAENELKIEFTPTSSQPSQTVLIGDIGGGETVAIPYRAAIASAGEAKLNTRYAGNLGISGRYSFELNGATQESTSSSQIPVIFTRPTDLGLPPALVFEIIETYGEPSRLSYLGSSDRLSVKSYRDEHFALNGTVKAFALVQGSTKAPVDAVEQNAGLWIGEFNNPPATTSAKGDTEAFSISGDGQPSLIETLEAQLNQDREAFLAHPYFLGLLGQWGDRTDKDGYLIPITFTEKKADGSIQVNSPAIVPQVPQGGLFYNGGGPVPSVQSEHGIIRLEIDQNISLERQAFNAKLKLTPSVGQLENVRLNLLIQGKDANGNAVDASAKFFVLVTENTGISPLNDPDQGTTVTGPAVLNWQIIPNSTAGGTSEEGLDYSVSATVDYSYGQANQQIATQEEIITVKPMPRLHLEYSLPEQLPAGTPVKFKLKVTNSGYGPARNLTVVSAQPRIIENTTGIPVDFHIHGSSPSPLAADYTPGQMLVKWAEIPPATTVECFWLLSASHSGIVIDMQSSLIHQDYRGVTLDPLIEDVVLTTVSTPEVATLTVVGGAWNYPENSPYKASFNLDVEKGLGIGGQLDFYYARTRLRLSSTAITDITLTGSTYTITGAATVNGAAGYSFVAIVSDSPASFGITVKDPAGNLHFSSAPAPVSGGVIQTGFSFSDTGITYASEQAADAVDVPATGIPGFALLMLILGGVGVRGACRRRGQVRATGRSARRMGARTG